MIEVRNGSKPVFLLDNQKTLTAHVDSDTNRDHRQPSDFDSRDCLITKRILDIFRQEYKNYESTIAEIRFEGILSQTIWLSYALDRDVDPDNLVIRPERSWQDIRSTLLLSRVSDLEKVQFDQPEDLTNWRIIDQGRRLLTGIKYELGCPQLVLSGIFNSQKGELDKSFREQGVIDLLSEPRFVLRVPGIRSTHLHKAFAHGALVNLGFATVAVDDDPNTINAIQKFVGCPAVLVSTPEEVELYNKSKGVNCIENPLNGPIYQKGVDSHDLMELAYRAYREWG